MATSHLPILRGRVLIPKIFAPVVRGSRALRVALGKNNKGNASTRQRVLNRHPARDEWYLMLSLVWNGWLLLVSRSDLKLARATWAVSSGMVGFKALMAVQAPQISFQTRKTTRRRRKVVAGWAAHLTCQQGVNANERPAQHSMMQMLQSRRAASFASFMARWPAHLTCQRAQKELQMSGHHSTQ